MVSFGDLMVNLPALTLSDHMVTQFIVITPESGTCKASSSFSVSSQVKCHLLGEANPPPANYRSLSGSRLPSLYSHPLRKIDISSFLLPLVVGLLPAVPMRTETSGIIFHSAMSSNKFHCLTLSKFKLAPPKYLFYGKLRSST